MCEFYTKKKEFLVPKDEDPFFFNTQSFQLEESKIFFFTLHKNSSKRLLKLLY